MKRISFSIGDKIIGEGHPCLIQSMSDIKTSHVSANIALTNDLARRGLDLMRFSVLDMEDAKAFREIKAKTSIPIIADIHFDYRLALESIASGVDKIRINPGNISSASHLRQILQACKEKHIPIRIGVNSGSLNRYRGKGKDVVEDILLAMDDTLSFFQEEGFEELVLSLKTSNPLILDSLYRQAYERYPYPLHIGLTESGFSTLGSIRSTVALYPLLKDDIGDTIRISLADDRKEELRACKELLSLAGRREHTPELIVCPGCGRTLVPLKDLSRAVMDHLDFVNKKIKVAVMGCPVNGVGEARDADYGIAGSGKENVLLLFSKGKEIGLFEKEEALGKLFSYIDSF